MLLNVAYYCIMALAMNVMHGGNVMFEFDYEKYEQECERIRTTNDKLLELFEKDLSDSGLSIKTINRHLANADFYINDFLLREEAHPMEDGVDMIYLFLGDFFIRKCKVKNVQIVFDVINIPASRNDDESHLRVPAENDLRIRFAIFFPQFREDWFLK